MYTSMGCMLKAFLNGNTSHGMQNRWADPAHILPCVAVVNQLRKMCLGSPLAKEQGEAFSEPSSRGPTPFNYRYCVVAVYICRVLVLQPLEPCSQAQLENNQASPSPLNAAWLSSPCGRLLLLLLRWAHATRPLLKLQVPIC